MTTTRNARQSDDAGLERLLKDMIKIPSVYPDEARLSGFLSAKLQSMGFDVELQEVAKGRHNVLAQRGEAPQELMFYGHIDTVPVADKSAWHTDPFTPVTMGTLIYGLGSNDMKGGIAAFLTAAERTVTPVKIFLAIDEENISEGAWSALQNRRDFFEGVTFVVSAEPGFGLEHHTITLGRTGRSIYEVSFEGRSAHLMNYREGIDSIELLGKFINDFYASRGSLFRSLDTVGQIRYVSGESVGMSVCSNTVGHIEVLSGKEDTIATIQQTLSQLAGREVRLKERKTPYLEGYRFSEEMVPHIDVIRSVISEHTSTEMTVTTRTSVGDDNALAVTLGVPVVTWGPQGVNGHAANEAVDRLSLRTVANMYTDLLRQIG